MKKILSGILLLMSVLFVTETSTQASIAPTKVRKETKRAVYDEGTVRLASKIKKLEDKYDLQYKSTEDLLETCAIIREQSKYTKFDQYEVAAIVLKESRFKCDALNKKDGGTGLMQLTRIKKYHNDTLFWVRNPKDKHQNIIGGLIILEEMRRAHKTKHAAIKYYNGSTKKSDMYRDRILQLKREIRAC